MGRSVKGFHNHSTSEHVFSKAIRSDSMVEQAIHIHLEDLQDTAPLPGKSITISGLLVILFEIQFVSLYLPVLVKIYHI